MIKLYGTAAEEVFYDEDEKETQFESVTVFKFENEDEAEEFSYLTHNEQIKALGLPEEKKLTNTITEIHRYFIDVGDMFVVVRDNSTTFD